MNTCGGATESAWRTTATASSLMRPARSLSKREPITNCFVLNLYLEIIGGSTKSATITFLGEVDVFDDKREGAEEP